MTDPTTPPGDGDGFAGIDARWRTLRRIKTLTWADRQILLLAESLEDIKRVEADRSLTSTERRFTVLDIVESSLIRLWNLRAGG